MKDTQYNGEREKGQNDKQRSTKHYTENYDTTSSSPLNTQNIQVPQKDNQFLNDNKTIGYFYCILQEQFGDTKVVIRSRQSQNNRQNKKTTKQIMDHKTLSRKLTIEQTTRISKTSEDKLKYRVNHDSERSCICVRVSILPLSTILKVALSCWNYSCCFYQAQATNTTETYSQSGFYKYDRRKL